MTVVRNSNILFAFKATFIVNCLLFRIFFFSIWLPVHTVEVNMSKIGAGFDKPRDDISLTSSFWNAELRPYSDLWAMRSQHNSPCHHL